MAGDMKRSSTSDSDSFLFSNELGARSFSAGLFGRAPSNAGLYPTIATSSSSASVNLMTQTLLDWEGGRSAERIANMASSEEIAASNAARQNEAAQNAHGGGVMEHHGDGKPGKAMQSNSIGSPASRLASSGGFFAHTTEGPSSSSRILNEQKSMSMHSAKAQDPSDLHSGFGHHPAFMNDMKLSSRIPRGKEDFHSGDAIVSMADILPAEGPCIPLPTGQSSRKASSSSKIRSEKRSSVAIHNAKSYPLEPRMTQSSLEDRPSYLLRDRLSHESISLHGDHHGHHQLGLSSSDTMTASTLITSSKSDVSPMERHHQHIQHLPTPSHSQNHQSTHPRSMHGQSSMLHEHPVSIAFRQNSDLSAVSLMSDSTAVMLDDPNSAAAASSSTHPSSVIKSEALMNVRSISSISLDPQFDDSLGQSSHSLQSAAAAAAANSGGAPTTKHKRERNKTHTPRPSNSFILYRREKHAEIMSQYKGAKALNNNVISKIVATMWRQEEPDVKAKYAAKAEEEKKAHMLKYPDYKYRPRKSPQKSGVKGVLQKPGNLNPMGGVVPVSLGMAMSDNQNGSYQPRQLLLSPGTHYQQPLHPYPTIDMAGAAGWPSPYDTRYHPIQHHLYSTPIHSQQMDQVPSMQLYNNNYDPLGSEDIMGGGSPFFQNAQSNPSPSFTYHSTANTDPQQEFQRSSFQPQTESPQPGQPSYTQLLHPYAHHKPHHRDPTIALPADQASSSSSSTTSGRRHDAMSRDDVSAVGGGVGEDTDGMTGGYQYSPWSHPQNPVWDNMALP